MKNALLGVAAAFLASVAMAQNVTPTVGGGTGTGVKPTGGQVLVGGSNGTYAPTTPGPFLLQTAPCTVAQGCTGATSAPAALTGLGAAPLASPTFTGTVTIPGGTINGTSIGGTTPGTGNFTAINGTSSTTLGVLSLPNTWTGRQTMGAGQSVNWNVNFAGGTSGEALQPYHSTQNPSGICAPDGAGNCVFNQWLVNSDNVDASSDPNGAVAFQWNENYGGNSSAKGTRNVGQFIINVIGTPSDAAGNHSYVPLQTNARAAVNMGGTANTIGGSSGALFGFNPYCSLATGATFWRGVNCDEHDVEIQAGASAFTLYGMSVIATANYATKAAQENVAFGVASQLSTVHPFDVAFQIGGYEGFPGIDTTGGFVRCVNNQNSGHCPGWGYALDFSNVASISGNLLAGPLLNSFIDGSGNYGGARYGGATAGAAVVLGSALATYNDLEYTPGLTLNPGVLQLTGVDANQSLYVLGSGANGAGLGNASTGVGVVGSADSGTLGATNYWGFHGLANASNFIYEAPFGGGSNITQQFRNSGTGCTQFANSNGSTVYASFCGSGTIDGISVGQTTPAAGSFTTLTDSFSGIASTSSFLMTGTPFTGGSSTTTKPLALIEPSTVTTSNNWSTAGTLFGVNAPAAFTGNVIQTAINGTPTFTVDFLGDELLNGGLTVGSSASIGSTFTLGKIAATGVAPGASKLLMEAVAGTTGGTCKIIAYAGTSTTPTTVIDNVGSGC